LKFFSSGFKNEKLKSFSGIHKMSRVVELAKKVEAKRVALDTAKVEYDESVAELSNELVTATEKPKQEGEKRGRKPRVEGDTSNKRTLKEIVKEILDKNPDGLELKGVTAVVMDMIKDGQYSSKASNVSAIVSQAINALKAEKGIRHDKQSKKYFSVEETVVTQ
jgi:hypothetical protein